VVKKEGAMPKSICHEEKHKTDSPDVVKSTKRKREEVKKEGAASKSIRDEERRAKRKKTLRRGRRW
jgi:hypothetical protein